MRQNTGSRSYQIPNDQKSIATIHSCEEAVAPASDAVPNQRHCKQFSRQQSAQSPVRRVHEASNQGIRFFDTEAEEEQCRAHIQDLEQYERK